MLVLGIETSCDETSAAVVRDGRDVLSNIVWSQVALHAPYGGVVPELASRAHVRNVSTVADLALRRAGVGLGEIGLIAATRGPGLVGSLLVGLEFAKSLAFARNVPLVAVHHIAAHLYSPFLRQHPAAYAIHSLAERTPASITGSTDQPCSISASTIKNRKSEIENRKSNLQPPKSKIQNTRVPLPRYPYLGLAISGGHTSLTRVEWPGRYRTLGETRDDAVGEAYDKVAKLLGLGYPGGPILDALAREGNPRAIRFPRPLAHEDTLDFSFSGLKTAVLHHVEKVGLETLRCDRARLCDLAASFQAAVIDSLLDKTVIALRREQLDRLAVVGGVACNAGLRQALNALWRGARSPQPSALSPQPSVLSTQYSALSTPHSAFRIPHSAFRRLWLPLPALCTDNAAMIAGLGYHLFRTGYSDNDLALNADPGWVLDGAYLNAGAE
jgi:N6-L-threonylcarbamoyladenine synthase